MPWNLEEAIAFYGQRGAPGDQSALVSLLREVQQENGGGIPEAALAPVAEAYGVKESYLLALIRRIPSPLQTATAKASIESPTPISSSSRLVTSSPHYMFGGTLLI